MNFDYENNAIIRYAKKALNFDCNTFDINKKTWKLEVKSKYSNEEACAGCIFSFVVVRKDKTGNYSFRWWIGIKNGGINVGLWKYLWYM